MKTLEELNKAAAHYYFTNQQTGIDNRCRERMITRCLKAVPKGRVLELGFMDGQWTDRFLEKGCHVTVVEGAARNPLAVPLPAGTPVARHDMDSFRARAQPLLAQIGLLGNRQANQVAALE